MKPCNKCGVPKPEHAYALVTARGCTYRRGTCRACLNIYFGRRSPAKVAKRAAEKDGDAEAKGHCDALKRLAVAQYRREQAEGLHPLMPVRKTPGNGPGSNPNSTAKLKRLISKEHYTNGDEAEPGV